MKRFSITWSCLLLLTLLCGCRVRIIGDPALAEQVLITTEAPASSELETTAPPETEAPAPTEPEPESSEETQEPETEAETKTNPEPTQTPEPASQPSQSSHSGSSGSSRAQVPVPAPIETQPPETVTPTLTLTLDPNGGDEGSMTLQLRQGEAYGMLPQAVRRGWRFDGWWTAPEGGQEILAEDLVQAAEDHTLYAHWAPGEAYTLTLDPTGGRLSVNDRSFPIRFGDSYGALPVPIREGYTFLGWWTDPAEGLQIETETLFESEEDETLYAHWAYDPFAYWSFMLENSKQRRYDCQKLTIYIETQESGVTLQRCGLITDTDSFNAAVNREDPNVEDEWVLEKSPAAIVKCVGSMSESSQAKVELSARFPGIPVYTVSPDGLGGGGMGLYARLALCKYLYPEWYTEMDLATVAAELGLAYLPLQ